MSTGTLHYKSEKANGDASSGSLLVTVNTTNQVVRDPVGNVVFQGPLTVRLLDGEVTLTLPATDDATLSPTGFTYSTTEQLDHVSKSNYRECDFTLPAGTTTDLADIADAVEVAADPSYGASLAAAFAAIAGKQDRASLDADMAAEITGGAAVRPALLASFTGTLDNASTSADGALAVQKLTKVDASVAARAMTIPDGTIKGQLAAAEKTDSSTNLVAVTGKIRSTGSSSINLTYQYETILFVWGGTFWEPLAGHRTKSSIDTQAQAVIDAAGVPSMLAQMMYTQGTQFLPSTTSATPSKVSSSLFRRTFTVPATGRVAVRMQAMTDGAGNGVQWCLLDANDVVIPGSGPATVSRAAAANNTRVTYEFTVGDLNPGDVLTWYWGFASSNGSNVARILCGGSGASAWGPAIMEFKTAPFVDPGLVSVSPLNSTSGAGLGLTNGATSWWTRDRSVQVAGALYNGFAQDDGTEVVTQIGSDTTERKLSLGVFEVDDHNNPSFLAVSGKPLLIGYDRHGKDNYLRFRKGTGNISSTALGPVGDEDLVDMTGQTSYVELHTDGTNVWAWCRIGGRYWGFTKSTTFGALSSWSTAKKVFDKGDSTQKMYMASRLLSDNVTLRCAFANHPYDVGGGVGGDHSVFYAEVNLSTGDITSGGAVIGNLATLTTPIVVPTTCEKVKNITGNNRAWIFDVGDGATPEVVFVDFDNTSLTTSGLYRYATKSGGVWTVKDVVASGAPFQSAPNYYYGGIQLASGGGTVYVSRKDASDANKWKIDRMVTANGGTSWTTTNLAVHATKILVRPWPIVGGSAGREVMYNAFTSFGNYTTWAGDIAVA